MISGPTRPHPLQEQIKETASIKTRGHLSLLEWDETLPASAAAPSFKNPTRRTILNRCYDGGTIILFIATIAALAASLCRF